MLAAPTQNPKKKTMGRGNAVWYLSKGAWSFKARWLEEVDNGWVDGAEDEVLVEAVEFMLEEIVLEERPSGESRSGRRRRRAAGANDVLFLSAASRAMLEAGMWSKYSVRATRRN